MPREPLEGMRRHKLFPKDVERALPDLYTQEDVPDPVVHLKLFSPYSGMRLYVTEARRVDTQDDGTPGGEPDVLLYGYMTGVHVPEWGYSSLREHAEAAGMGGRLPLIERDCHFLPTPLSEALKADGIPVPA